MISLAVDHPHEALPSCAVYVLELVRGSDELRVSAGRSEDGDAVSGFSIPVSATTPLQGALAAGAPITLGRLDVEWADPVPAELLALGRGRALWAPLRWASGASFGLVGVQSDVPGDFTAEEIERVASVAPVLSGGLSSTRGDETRARLVDTIEATTDLVGMVASGTRRHRRRSSRLQYTRALP